MQIKIKYLIISFLLLINSDIYGFGISSDTIPPIFTTPASDLSINCDNTLIDNFSNWYLTAGGAQADNGEAEVNGVFSLDSALILLGLQHATNCSQSLELTFGFIAVDSCNNVSIDTSFASFEFSDTQGPVFNMPVQSLAVECDFGIQDTLMNWIASIGYAQTADNCSDTTIFSSYSWQDSNGNSGFGSPQNNTAIPIDRSTCLWYVDVSFFIEDECGNIATDQGRFEILPDTIPPQIFDAPIDTIILCDAVLPDEQPVFIDGCDSLLVFSSQSISDQDPDPNNCNAYNYSVSTTWMATDVCGNSSQYTRTVTYIDTLVPEVQFDLIVAFDCDEAITIDEALISYEDNCSAEVMIDFRDSLIASNVCQEQFIRFWTLTDICGNSNELEQTIQVQDFSVPVINPAANLDTTIDCSTVSPQQVFEDWLDYLLTVNVEDNCSIASKYVVNPGQYADTASIIAANRPELNLELCPTMNSSGVLGTQNVRLFAFDNCGNIVSKAAFFTITDTIVPQITICPPNRSVTLDEDFCSRNTRLLLPLIQDNCVQVSPDNWDIEFENQIINFTNPDSIFVDLEVGIHAFEYTYTDCAGNQVSCSNTIRVRDTFAPVLTCPEDVTAYASQGNCSADVLIEQIVDYTDNCQGPIDYEQIKPDGSSLVNFSYNPLDSAFQASNRILVFDDITSDGIVFKPQLTIEYALDLDAPSELSINSELGDILYVIDSADCSTESVTLELNTNQFKFWAVDGEVKFTLVHKKNGGKGTNPCLPGNINGNQGTDGFSYIRLILEYSDIIPEVTLTESLSNDTISENYELLTLPVGNYTAEYKSIDRNNNEGSCQTRVFVQDTIQPIISCTSVILEAALGPDTLFAITLADLNYSTTDNCQIENVTHTPLFYNCSLVGQSLQVDITVNDIYGNSNHCTTTAILDSEPIEITFSSNLCFADTLRLFSQVDPTIVDSYSWTGPANFESTQANPVINNIDISNSGVYRLEIITNNGCRFEGEIDIEVNDFVNPQIMVDSTRYCEGESILFNASIYSENVDYFWYEGISPNGILLDQTDGPSLQVTPNVGEHFYYVEVRSEDCSSNPSNTIALEVFPVPDADVTQPFITVCEGETVTFESEINNPEYQYFWEGPNGYQSMGSIPETITEAEPSDQGNYLLTISNNGCISDTAVVQLVVFESPATPQIIGDNIFCQGQSAVLTATTVSNAVRYHWYKDNILFSSNSTSSLLIPSINQSHSGIWTVIVEDGICFSEVSPPFEVFVESSLNIGASNNGPLCEGDLVDLTSSFIPGASYQWVSPSGLVYQGREVTVPAVQGAYTVTVTTASNCTASATTEVTVANRPQITALSNTSLACMNANMSVTFVPTVFPPGNYTYEWSGPENFTSNLNNPVINNVTENNNGEYSIVIKSGNCVSDTVSTFLNINLIPAQAIIGGNLTPCEGDTLLLTVNNPPSNGNRRWIWTTPLGQINTNVPALEILNFSANNVGNYSVIQERNSCRSLPSNNVAVNFLANPSRPILNANSILCEGETLVITTSNSNADEYIWFTPNGTTSTSVNRLEIQNADKSDQGIYSVAVRLGNCRSDNSLGLSITVKDRPERPLFNQSELASCDTDNVLANVCFDFVPPNAVNLEIIDLQSGIKISEGPGPCFDLSFLNVGISNTFRIIGRTEIQECFSAPSDTLTIRTFSVPDNKAEVEDDLIIICNQEFANASVEAVPSGITWEWTSPDPEINIFDANELTASFTNLREGNNQIFLISSNGVCEDYARDTLRIFVISELEAIDDEFEDNITRTVLIDVLSNDIYNQQITITNISTPGEGTAVIKNNLIEYTPPGNFVGFVSLDYEICYDECPDFCSSATLQIKIGDNLDCFAGNVITPNNDGYNDGFIIPCLDSGDYPSNRLTIFNQWGDELYDASPYLNNWQGTYNGEILPVGTYFYILDLGDGTNPIQGFIVLEL